MNCTLCEHFTFKLEDGRPVEYCEIRGRLFLPYLERLSPCCGTACVLESSFYLQLEEVARNCEHFRRRF